MRRDAPSPPCDAGAAMACTAYLAAEGFADDLAHELGGAARRHGRLLIAAGPARPAAWAANAWLDPQEIAIASISDAAAKLRAIQRNWAVYAPRLYRRAMLIQQQLPKISAKPLVFGTASPSAPLGSWTLLDARTVLAAPHCTNPFPNGEIHFVEDRTGPPSRAYLKLWEALTLIGRRPRPGETCLDLGSSPGGWSWALQQMGAQVISVDKAPLLRKSHAFPASSTGRRAPLRSTRARSDRSIGCFRTSFAIRPGFWRWSSGGSPPGPAATSSARSNSKARPTTRPPGASPRSRARSCATCSTTSTSSPG